MYVAVIGWLKKVELIERLYVHHYHYTLFNFEVSYNLFEKHANSVILH